MPASGGRRGITTLLENWGQGDGAALGELMPQVMEELKSIAAGYLRGERPGHTLQPTALVNELYLRLYGRRQVSWSNRAHFFGFAAQTMRRILVDHARAHQSRKRGGELRKVALSDEIPWPGERDVDLVALDDALDELSGMDEVQGRIIELRFFAGLTLDQVAEVTGLSAATVSRHWASARAWLFQRLGGR